MSYELNLNYELPENLSDYLPIEVTLPPEVRVKVVYRLLDEGWSADDIADNVKGVGPTLAKSLEHQKNQGCRYHHRGDLKAGHHRREMK
jgi:hypothetical protein